MRASLKINANFFHPALSMLSSVFALQCSETVRYSIEEGLKGSYREKNRIRPAQQG